MKKLIHLMLRLYPAAWRERYGAEFQCVVDDLEPAWTDVVDVLKGGVQMQLMQSSVPVMAAAFGILGILVAGGGSLALQDRFESRGRIGFQPQAPATLHDVEKVRGIAHQMFKDSLSRTSLAAVIEKHDLYSRERANQPLEKVVDHMLRNIRIISYSKPHDVTYELAFIYPDRHKAQRVAKHLIALFMEQDSRQERNAYGMASQPSLELLSLPDLPLAPAGPNRTAIAGAGLGGGALLGAIVALVRRRLAATAQSASAPMK